MCRHAAAVGPSIRLTELVFDLPHGLEHQSYAAKELLTGSVCADGFGVAWYDADTRAEPGRYASAMPVWSDKNLRSFGPIVHSNLVMAAVRNATVAGSNIEANCAPFVSGKYAFSHNGFLQDLPRWTAWLKDQIDPQIHIHGDTDSAWLFAMILTRVQSDDLPTAVQSVVKDVLAHGASENLEAHLNLLVADGQRLVATRAGTGAQNSLYHLADGEEFPGCHVVASEPLYEDAWTTVQESTIVILQAGAPPVRLNV